MIFLITGSSKGIGKYLTKQYLEKGHLVIGCSRGKSDINHENYKHFLVDVTREEEIKRMLSKIRKEFKKVDILINNAGIASMNHFLLTPTKTAQKVMNVNYLGTFMMCREVSRIMRKSDNPRIINFTTVAVPLSLEGEAAYVSSKSAVGSLTKVLAKELAQYDITVNLIGPTPVKTNLIDGVPEDKLNNLLNKQTIKRYGKKEDIKNVIDFYIKPESDFITGQTIYLGGIN